jgi:hypothetical protein
MGNQNPSIEEGQIEKKHKKKTTTEKTKEPEHELY